MWEAGGRALRDPHSGPLFLSGGRTQLWWVQGLTQLLTHHVTLTRAFPAVCSTGGRGQPKPQAPSSPDFPGSTSRYLSSQDAYCPAGHSCLHCPQAKSSSRAQEGNTGAGQLLVMTQVSTCVHRPKPSTHYSIPAHTPDPYITPASSLISPSPQTLTEHLLQASPLQ